MVDKLWIAVAFFALLGVILLAMAMRLVSVLVGLYPPPEVSREILTGNSAFANVLLYLKVETIGLAVFGAVAWSIAIILAVVIRRSKRRSQ